MHYVRPGCGRDSNYPQQTQLVDAQYSLFYRQVSCFSLLDMAADASYIDLSARDSVGNEFYTYRFMLDGSDRPQDVQTPQTATSPEKVVKDGAVFIRRQDGEMVTMLGLPYKRKNN